MASKRFKAPKRSDGRRSQRIMERETQHCVDGPSLRGTAKDGDRISSQLHAPEAVRPQLIVPRNYEPALQLESIEISIKLVSGNNITLPSVPVVQTTIGKADTADHVRGLLHEGRASHNEWEKHYEISDEDIKSISICFTDAAGYRHREEYVDKYNGKFGIWAGEVEGGDLYAKTPCICEECDGVHGPEIEVRMDEGKFCAALLKGLAAE